jgi:pSer/pThr/pTyr-binding forkhead associated (FHA) protein
LNKNRTFKKEDKIVSIGRKNDCNMVINDTSISREQLVLMYNNDEKHWFIKDGNLEKGSSNGSWYISFFNKVVC